MCEAGKVAANDILSSSKVQGQHSVRSRQLLQHVEPFVASMADKRRHLETVVKLHELVNKVENNFCFLCTLTDSLLLGFQLEREFKSFSWTTASSF